MKDHLKRLVDGGTPAQGRNIAREYLQGRILGAFQRVGAMTSLAFQGGTCLRFVFGLPRYSEDLDFALEGDRSTYSLRGYLQAVRSELAAEDYTVELRLREQRVVHSALVRFPGILHELGLSPRASEVLAVRVEVDTNPPPGAGTEIHLVRRHVTLRLYCHDRASLLAGKVHALLARPYAKGRDWFDLIWYLSDPEWPPPNMDLLKAALGQSGWTGEALGLRNWRSAIARRLDELDWERIVADVRPFLEGDRDVESMREDNVARLLR